MRAIAFPEIELVLKENNEMRALAQHGLINYLKTFKLPLFTEFLERIKAYNNYFTKRTFYPEMDGKTKVISSEFHRNHLEVLEKPSTWIGLAQVNARLDDKIQSLGKQWRQRVARALPTSETLLHIVEAKELDELKKWADAALKEARRKKSKDKSNQAIYRQIISYLQPFIKGNYILSEKNRVLNDLLARLHVSCYSDQADVDDVVHYVTSCLNHLNVAGQLCQKINEKQTQQFLKNPHYRGMNEAVFNRIIHYIEMEGSLRHIQSLRRLPIFTENSEPIRTRNFSNGRHVFAVPVFLVDYVPRSKPWPAWLFPNRSFRYHFFQDKQWFLHTLKNESFYSGTRVSTDTIKAALDQASLQAQDVRQKMAQAAVKSTKIFLEKWQCCIQNFQDHLEQKISVSIHSPSPRIPIPEPAPSSQTIITMNDSSVNAEALPRWCEKQKIILDGFFQMGAGKELSSFKKTLILQILRNARAALRATEDTFAQECRRYIGAPFFNTMGEYLMAQSTIDPRQAPPDELRIFMACLFDFFSLANLVKELRIDFAALFRKILTRQLKILCENLIQDYKVDRLSPENIADYQTHLRGLILISERHISLNSFLVDFCKEIILIKNAHILEVKCHAILDGINANRLATTPLSWKKSAPENQYQQALSLRGASL